MTSRESVMFSLTGESSPLAATAYRRKLIPHVEHLTHWWMKKHFWTPGEKDQHQCCADRGNLERAREEKHFSPEWLGRLSSHSIKRGRSRVTFAEKQTLDFPIAPLRS